MGFMALGMSLHWVCPFFNATRIFFLPPPSLWLVHLIFFFGPSGDESRSKFRELDDGKIYRNHRV